MLPDRLNADLTSLTVHALGFVRCSDVFAVKCSAPMRSSAARAALDLIGAEDLQANT